ncbi:MAG TPA: hypothetical protein VJZ27_08610, partial [Aggregatilineales bacterium]|nr:hypothetical protein [Aggregatilineales bacterium]
MSKIEDILAELADGFLDGSIEITDLIEKYNILPGSELETLLQLAASLEGMLLPVSPSSDFIRKLRHELLNEETET